MDMGGDKSGYYTIRGCIVLDVVVQAELYGTPGYAERASRTLHLASSRAPRIQVAWRNLALLFRITGTWDIDVHRVISSSHQGPGVGSSLDLKAPTSSNLCRNN